MTGCALLPLLVIQPLTSLKRSKINEAVTSIGAAQPCAAPAAHGRAGPDRPSGRAKCCSCFNFLSLNIVSGSVDPK